MPMNIGTMIPAMDPSPLVNAMSDPNGKMEFHIGKESEDIEHRTCIIW